MIEINRTRINSLIVLLEGFTELDKYVDEESDHKYTFRAHPGYYDGREWLDWAFVHWDTDEDLEAKIQMFLNFKTIKVVTRTKAWEPPPINTRTPSGAPINIRDATPSGLCAIVSTVVDNPQERSKQFMKTAVGKRLEIAKHLQMVPTDAILGTTFVIEEECFDGTLLSKKVVSYLHVTKWGDLFLPENWISPDDVCPLNDPNVSSEANTVTEELIQEENRAAFILETFDGFVENYRE